VCLTAAVFVGVVVTIQNAVTTLARRNALSVAAPKISSSAVYVEQTPLYTSNIGITAGMSGLGLELESVALLRDM